MRRVTKHQAGAGNEVGFPMSSADFGHYPKTSFNFGFTTASVPRFHKALPMRRALTGVAQQERL